MVEGKAKKLIRECEVGKCVDVLSMREAINNTKIICCLTNLLHWKFKLEIRRLHKGFREGSRKRTVVCKFHNLVGVKRTAEQQPAVNFIVFIFRHVDLKAHPEFLKNCSAIKRHVHLSVMNVVIENFHRKV